MSMQDLVQEIRKFERSSGYRYGDRKAFSVRLAEGLLLKGPNSAAAYLDELGLDTLPERVMVVGPANGGLAVECYQRGAKRVICMEPRSRFQATLKRVLKFQERVWQENEVEGNSYRIVERWQQVRENDGFQDVDLIIWPEGMEEITRPKEVFQTIDTALKPGGKLVLEAKLGRHEWVEKINSWIPSEHGIRDMGKEIFGSSWTSKQPGRGGASTTAIFTFEKAGAVPKKAAKPKKKAPKAPKAPPAPPPAAAEPVVILDEEGERKIHLDLVKEEAPKPTKKKKTKSKKTAKKRKKKTSKKSDPEPAGSKSVAAEELPSPPPPPAEPPQWEAAGE